MLEVSKLMRKYGRFTAVKDASFTIQSGEIVGLLGHNGAGKTTILKMLSGFMEPHQGHINLDGVDVVESPKTTQQMMGYLPENLPVYPEMHVAGYLDYAASLKGIAQQERYEAIRRVIKATDIRDKLFSPIATLSRGYKQRVGVAQALLGQPKLLILDEPTNGLDPTQTAHMRQLIRDVAQHATVILSTHIMQEVEALCDRVLIIRSGELVIDAKLDELKQSNQLSVHCSLSFEQIQQQLETISIKDITPIEQQEGHYQITVIDEKNLQHVSSLIAKQITASGELYALQPVVTDLETLFRQVNQQPMENREHAA
ncbi:MAG: Vitamin B12 import ATP-binding protein BtuD [Candidatus Celerinatantimonas neptuna]|nr:MAG: Vitamin B12 import ATP-binding protein BtuD [Candidatus Celerinatantimonas neptuna]